MEHKLRQFEIRCKCGSGDIALRAEPSKNEFIFLCEKCKKSETMKGEK